MNAAHQPAYGLRAAEDAAKSVGILLAPGRPQPASDVGHPPRDGHSSVRAGYRAMHCGRPNSRKHVICRVQRSPAAFSWRRISWGLIPQCRTSQCSRADATVCVRRASVRIEPYCQTRDSAASSTPSSGWIQRGVESELDHKLAEDAACECRDVLGAENGKPDDATPVQQCARHASQGVRRGPRSSAT